MTVLTFGTHQVELSHTNKVFYPDEGLTKGDVVEYYQRVAPVILPHIRDRPLVVHRFPDGIEGEAFFHKDTPDYFPDWIETIEVRKEGGTVRHVLCNSEACLIYLANQACLTPHVWLSRADQLRRPDRMIFDLDPAEDDFAPVRKAAGRLRELLEELQLPAYPMTTGSRGVHLVAPLNRGPDFDEVREFARQVADLLVARYPESLTTEARKNKRGTCLFVDVMRNAYAQTTVAPYSLRARPGAPVATPLYWDELDHRDLHARSFTLLTVFARLEQTGDPWDGLGRHGRSLDEPRRLLQRMKRS